MLSCCCTNWKSTKLLLC